MTALEFLTAVAPIGALVWAFLAGAKARLRLSARWRVRIAIVLGAGLGAIWQAVGWLDTPAASPALDYLVACLVGVLVTMAASGATNDNVLAAVSRKAADE